MLSKYLLTELQEKAGLRGKRIFCDAFPGIPMHYSDGSESNESLRNSGYSGVEG